MNRESKKIGLLDSRFTIHDSRFRVPRWGRYHVLVAMALLVIGLYRGINLLTLLGYALLAMAGLNLLAAGRSLRGLRVRRRITEWVFARTPCQLEVQVSNSGRRPRLGLRIEDRGPEHAVTWYADRLPGRDRQTFRRDVTLPRRGRYAWGTVAAVSGYPFGLVERRVALAPAEDVIVLPRLGWLHRGRFVRHLRNLTAEPQSARVRNRPCSHPAAQAEFHGLRSYRSGDSPRLIHWRTSARRGELMVREFEDEPSDNLLLVFDPTLPAELNCGTLREQFEEAVSLVATICWEWCRRRGDRLVLAAPGPEPVVMEGLTGPIHARRVLECLADLPARTVPAGSDLIARLKASALPRALAVLVSLGRSSLADALPQALGRPVNCLDAARTDRFDFYTPPN
jgi:uncharacterized protein (DUF58 family)